MSLVEIKTSIGAISAITEEAWSELSTLFETKSFKANERILEFGQKAQYIYFLHQGLVRSFILTEDGYEFSKSILDEQHFFAPITSLVTKAESQVCFECLTNSLISRAPYAELERLHSSFPDLEHFYRRQLEWLYVSYERSEIERATLDAAERYLNLRNRIPKIDSLIPQYKIASYLGISNVQLSRIRKKLSSGSF